MYVNINLFLHRTYLTYSFILETNQSAVSQNENVTRYVHLAVASRDRVGNFRRASRGCGITLTHSGKLVNTQREGRYGRLDPFSGLPKGSHVFRPVLSSWSPSKSA